MTQERDIPSPEGSNTNRLTNEQIAEYTARAFGDLEPTEFRDPLQSLMYTLTIAIPGRESRSLGSFERTLSLYDGRKPEDL